MGYIVWVMRVASGTYVLLAGQLYKQGDASTCTKQGDGMWCDVMQVWGGSAMQAVQADPQGWPAHQPIHRTHTGWRSNAQSHAQRQLLLLQLLHRALRSRELPQLLEAGQF